MSGVLYRRATIGLFAGLVTGLLAAIAVRVAMRMVAISGGVLPTFSVAGTLMILLVAILYGVAGGVLFALGGRELPGTGAGKGLAYGLLVLVCFGPAYFVSDQEGELPISPLVGVLSFSTVFVLGGVMIGVATAWLERRLPREERDGRFLAYRLLGGLGLLIAVGCIPAMVSRVVLALQRVGALAIS